MKRVEGYHPDFDLDLEFGHQGEETVARILGLDGHAEVKTKARLDDKFYIETEQDPGGRDEWKPSGLKTTKADWWVFSVANVHCQMFRVKSIELALLLRRHSGGRVAATECVRGDNPTKGYLVDGSWLRECAYRLPFTDELGVTA